MYKRNIKEFFKSYLLFGLVLFNTACCTQHHPNIPDNLHHIVPAKNEHFHAGRHNCRLICTNQFEGLDDSQKHNGEFNRSSSTGRGDLPSPLQILNNLPGNSASLVGIVFNRTGAFHGLVPRISNLRDVIQGFPNSGEIIITRLEQIRNNPFLRGLLQFGNQLYSNEYHMISAESEQVASRRIILQEMFQKLPKVTGIFSAPIGLMLNPFHIRQLDEAFRNLNPSDILSQFRILFHRIPSLTGIFLKPSALFKHGSSNVSLKNSTVIFFGAERGYLIFKTLFDRVLSQLNLNHSASSEYLFRFLPFLADIIKNFPRLNTTDNDNESRLVYSLFNLGNILNNSSLLNELIRQPFKFYEIPEATNYQQTYILRLFENLLSFYTGNSRQSFRIRELFNRFSENFYKFLNSGDRSLNGTNLHQFFNILNYFEKSISNRNLNINEIINRFSYEINNLNKIFTSRRFSSNTRLRPFLNILRYFEGTDGNHVPGNFDLHSIIARFSNGLNNLYQFFTSVNASAGLTNNARLRQFLDVLHYLEKAVGNSNSENLKDLNNFYKVLSSENSFARFLIGPFLNVLHNFANLGENTFAQAADGVPRSTKNSTTLPRELTFRKHEISTTSKSTTSNLYTTTAENGNRIVGTGGNGIGGARINEKSTKRHSQEKHGRTANSSTNKGGKFVTDTGSNGNGGTGSGSIGISDAGINEKSTKQHSQEKHGRTSKSSTNKGGTGTGGNEKSAKEYSEGKIKSYEKHGTTAKPSIKRYGNGVVGIGGNGNGGTGSGSIGTGGAGVTEKNAKHPSQQKYKTHAEENKKNNQKKMQL